MSFFKRRFDPSDVKKFVDKKNVKGLIKALNYQEDHAVRRKAAEALGHLGDARAVDPLITALKDEKAEVRMAAVKALGQLGDARAVEPLVGALKDGDGKIRRAAANALGQLGDVRAVEPLVTALKKDRDGAVRQDAAAALGQLGDARAVEPLIDVVNKKDKWVRHDAIEALGQIGDVRAIDPLLTALEDEDVQVVAAEALGRLKDARAVEKLLGALKDERARMRQAAADALKQIGWEPGQNDDAAYYWFALEQWDQGLVLGSHAVGALTFALRYAPEAATIKKAVEASKRIGETVSAVDVLSARLGSTTGMKLEVVQTIIAALGQLGDDRAVDRLLAILKSGKIEYYQSAYDALKQIGGPKAEKAIEAYEAARKDLAQLVDESVNRLIAIYRENPDGFRTGSQEAPAVEIRDIGWKLHRQGGFTLMQGVHAEFAQKCGVRGAPRNLEFVWNRVGDWMS